MGKIREFTSAGSAARAFLGPKNLRTSLLAGALLLNCSCSTPRATQEPWVYGLSRNFYPAVCVDGELISALAQDTRYECAAVAIIVVFALPFAIDTCLLPITVTHDLMIAH